MGDAILQVAIMTLGWYGVVGMVFGFYIAHEALQHKDITGNMLTPYEWALSVVVMAIIWPLVVIELLDQHKDGPWKG